MMLRVEAHREQLRLSEEEKGDLSLLDLLAAQKSESEVSYAEAKKSLDVLVKQLAEQEALLQDMSDPAPSRRSKRTHNDMEELASSDDDDESPRENRTRPRSQVRELDAVANDDIDLGEEDDAATVRASMAAQQKANVEANHTELV